MPASVEEQPEIFQLISSGNLEGLKELFKQNPRAAKIRYTNGLTALLWAAGNGHLPTVQWLLAEGGASITEKNTMGSTALLLAALNGQLPIVQWLLTEGGASITEQNTQGDTALLCAASKGHLRIVQWLLTEGGVSITEQNTQGDTALLWAAFKGHLHIVQWLLTCANANIHETNKVLKNALAEAMRNKAGETALFLYHYGRPHNASIRCLSPEEVNVFDHLKQTEIGHVRAVAENCGGSLPWDLIKIINAYAFICLSEEEIQVLQEQNTEQKQSNADTQQNYIFILKTLRAFLLLGAVAGIVTLITASTLLTGGALTAVVITGGVIGAASTFAFFQTHKAINRQQTALPIQVEETPVLL